MITTLLGRYIGSTIIKTTGLVALVILGILLLMTLLTELKDIGIGDYGMLQGIFFVLLRLPNLLYDFSPIIILLGSILGLSSLSSNRELSVMRTSGFSIRNIMRSALGSGLILVIMMTLVGEWIGPRLSASAEIRKENAQHGGQAVITSSGVWFHIDNNFIHVQQVIGRQLLEGVTRYEFDNNHRMRAAYYAKTLTLENNEWLMRDTVKTTFYEARTKSESFATLPWDLKFNANLLNMGLVYPSEMTLPKLLKYARYLEKNGLQASEYQFNFWQRLFKPLAALIMIFLALPFVLGALHNSNMGWRIFAGVIVGFMFYILNALLGQICIVYQVPALIAAMVPILLFGIAGVVLAGRLLRR